MTLGRSQLERWIEGRLPRPVVTGVTGARRFPRRPIKRIVLLGRLPNPTYDYYFAGRLAADGMPPYDVVDIREGEPTSIDPEGAFLIVCRYATRPVLAWIERNAGQLAGVVLFIDDDIPAVVTGRDATLGYRLFLSFRALWPLRRLNPQLDAVWTSTAPLAGTLATRNVSVLPPAPARYLWQRNPNVSPGMAADRSSGILIAFHATAVHREEHRFLRPIIRAVLDQRPQVRFEVFADEKAAVLWKGIDRVSIRKPLPWAAYLADGQARTIDIMLVPLSPSRENDSRAPTKRIDVARYGAAGIFSASFAYGEPDDSNELRLPYDPEAWRNSILVLIDDEAMRQRAAAITSALAAEMGGRAESGIPDLFPDLSKGGRSALHPVNGVRGGG